MPAPQRSLPPSPLHDGGEAPAAARALPGKKGTILSVPVTQNPGELYSLACWPEPFIKLRSFSSLVRMVSTRRLGRGFITVATNLSITV